jgi:hypothetical protein
MSTPPLPKPYHIRGGKVTIESFYEYIESLEEKIEERDEKLQLESTRSLNPK